MKFFGNGVVWDKEREKVLCAFIEGEFETEDKRTVDILLGLEYESDGIEIETEGVVTNEPAKIDRNSRKNSES